MTAPRPPAPVPLCRVGESAPHAYACGHCLFVRVGYDTARKWTAEDTEATRLEALRCCACMTCGAFVPRDAGFFGHTCDAYRADRYLRADVRCDCGVEKAGLYAHNLKTLASCGCVVRKRREESPVVGRRYGRLVVVERLQSKPPIYRVVCDCGNERVVRYNNMHNGRTRSCGCYARDVMRENPPGRTHGATGTPEHRTWLAMLSRCYSTGAPRFDSYGGRGIYVCARWRNDFAAFLADMGPRPQGRYSIDRINNDGSYTCGKCGECLAKGAPSNCRWADLQTQARNTRRNIWIIIGGVHRLAADVCREHGVSKQTFSNRLAAGWTRKAAATTPPDPARVARGRALRNAALARRTEAA